MLTTGTISASALAAAALAATLAAAAIATAAIATTIAATLPPASRAPTAHSAATTHVVRRLVPSRRKRRVSGRRLRLTDRAVWRGGSVFRRYRLHRLRQALPIAADTSATGRAAHLPATHAASDVVFEYVRASE